MSDHQHGTMDARDHEKVFEGFLKFAFRFAIAVAIFLVLLAIFNA